MFFHIIDDQPLICFFISEVLHDLGYETEIFTSSEKYLEYLESPEYVIPAAVISDITMPVQNGYQVMERVLSRHPESHFVMMSGTIDIKSEYMKKGCIFLRKPFHLVDLESAVASVSLCH